MVGGSRIPDTTSGVKGGRGGEVGRTPKAGNMELD